MIKQLKLKTFIITLLWYMPFVISAQAVMISVRIDTITPLLEQGVMSFQLETTNAGSIGKLLVRIEDSRTNNLIHEAIFPVTNIIEIQTNILKNGNRYRVTVIGQTLAGQNIINEFTNGRGEIERVPVGDVKEFTFDAGTYVTSLLLTGIKPGETFQTYVLEVQSNQLADAQDYRLRVVDGNNKTILDTIYPSLNPDHALTFEMDNQPNGDYVAVLWALNGNSEVIVPSNAYEFTHIDRRTFWDHLRGSSMTITVIVLIAMFFLILFAKLLFPSKQVRYGYSPNKRVKNNTILDDQSHILSRVNETQRKQIDRKKLAEEREQYRENVMGSYTARLIVEHPEAIRSKSFTVKTPRVVIGSESWVDLRLPVAGVSRQHAVITFENNTFYIEDLDSMNNTFIRKKGIKGMGKHRLEDMVTIDIGKSALLVFRVSKNG